METSSVKDRPKPPPRRKPAVNIASNLPPIEENKVPPVQRHLSAKHKLPPPPVPAATIREGVEAEAQFAMPRLTNLGERDIMDRIKENCNKLPIKTQYNLMVN